jgi:hypothetical protein
VGVRLGAELDQAPRQAGVEPWVEAQIEVGRVLEVGHRPAGQQGGRLWLPGSNLAATVTARG